MKTGFIGTGAITEAFITGMINVGSHNEAVLVSSRSTERSKRLAEKFPNVKVIEDNQAIVDQCDWVFVAVLPEQSRELIKSLSFGSDQKIISMVAGLELEELTKICQPAESVFRIIPLPPVELGLGPMPLCPPDAEVESFLEKISTPIPVESENQFSTFSAASAIMATHYETMATVARWINSKDVPPAAAAGYTTAIFGGLSELASKCDWSSLQALPGHSQTPGGLNEQVLHELQALKWFDQVSGRLDRISDRLSGTDSK
ncbi:MAG: NAD(P)-binding domain-containing protein [Mariniblastus sp.]